MFGFAEFDVKNFGVSLISSLSYNEKLGKRYSRPLLLII